MFERAKRLYRDCKLVTIKKLELNYYIFLYSAGAGLLSKNELIILFRFTIIFHKFAFVEWSLRIHHSHHSNRTPRVRSILNDEFSVCAAVAAATITRLKIWKICRKCARTQKSRLTGSCHRSCCRRCSQSTSIRTWSIIVVIAHVIIL